MASGELTRLRERLRRRFLEPEPAAVRALGRALDLDRPARDAVAREARGLVEAVRAGTRPLWGVETLLQQFALDSPEGIALMCLAEAVLRIPDAATQSALIHDRLAGAEWHRHIGDGESLLVNAAGWALALTGRLYERPMRDDVAAALKRLVARAGDPIVRRAVATAIAALSEQFVMGETIAEGLARARHTRMPFETHSFDMLGEAARTAEDAERYFGAYLDAIEAIGRDAAAGGGEVRPESAPGISIKLSALHPRYEPTQAARVLDALAGRVRRLAERCRRFNIGMTIDAEEADRLDLSLDVIEATFAGSGLEGWDGYGVAVQAYQKRAPAVLDWLAALARSRGRRMMVRLVKGAYWDAEIKRGQERGLASYPVFTRKAWTDLSYLACARAMLAATDALYPQFATHNAHTIAALHHLSPAGEWELQRLHGMGAALHRAVAETLTRGRRCRVYSPVGRHRDLLPYLVRRLLENGANSSFVHKIADPDVPVAEVVRDPLDALDRDGPTPHPRIPLPVDIFGPERRNSAGIDFSDRTAVEPLLAAMRRAAEGRVDAAPLIGGRPRAPGPATAVPNPSRPVDVVGSVAEAGPEEVDEALGRAAAAFPAWDRTPVAERARALRRAADLYEANRAELMMLLVREAGRTLPDALGEVREAVDFLRYYAAEAERLMAAPLELPGITGESNRLALAGRGVAVSISPWNFPLSIFAGQLAAALAAGNPVIAKPAEQTPLTGFRAVRLLHEAGVPTDVLQLATGGGRVGALLTADPRVAAVAFTGSTATARAIARALAARDAPLAVLVAETGGQNALIADSSALPEQVVADAIRSAFDSAGQRCSAARILCLQAEVAERIETMLAGAMRELRVGDPFELETDLGPAIDREALEGLRAHVGRLRAEGRIIAETPLPDDLPPGHFIAPVAARIEEVAWIGGEVFGPVLHVLRYRREELDALVDALEATGYGLTLGIHSRLDSTVEQIVARARVGNIYVNRDMIGAVVGAQPFGGERLSGTGPKAGGPHYLERFTVERTLTVNTTAVGGNTTLVSLREEAEGAPPRPA